MRLDQLQDGGSEASTRQSATYQSHMLLQYCGAFALLGSAALVFASFAIYIKSFALGCDDDNPSLSVCMPENDSCRFTTGADRFGGGSYQASVSESCLVDCLSQAVLQTVLQCVNQTITQPPSEVEASLATRRAVLLMLSAVLMTLVGVFACKAPCANDVGQSDRDNDDYYVHVP